jgi:hypothetical protein
LFLRVHLWLKSFRAVRRYLKLLKPVRAISKAILHAQGTNYWRNTALAMALRGKNVANFLK